MRILTAFVLFAFLNSCIASSSDHGNNYKDSSIRYLSSDSASQKHVQLASGDEVRRDSLALLCYSRGDKNAYFQLYMIYEQRKSEREFLPYALDMANKYGFPKAYYDVFYIITMCHGAKALNDIDPKSKNLALYYLLKSFEMGYDQSKYQIEEYFLTEKPKRSAEYMDKYLN